MSLIGLGQQKKLFIYLDDYINIDVNWEQLHTEVCFGISRSKWEKKFVSSGVHEDWSDCEITPYLTNFLKNLTPYQTKFYLKCRTTEEKIKYLTSLGPIAHPFWSVFLRYNKKVEQTGIANKSVGDDCSWTENAKHFNSLVNLIEQLPFSEVGRVMLFMTEANNQTVPHYDAISNSQRLIKKNDDFIWFTTKPNTKNIFVMDGETKERTYADTNKKFVWFNEMDYHGTEPTSHFSFSVRIDGKFTPELKQQLI